MRVAARRRDADEWALVLAAEGVAASIRPSPSGFALFVAAGDGERAERILSVYERENPPPREVEPAGSRRANLGGGFAEARVYHGAKLRPGDVVPSPAIIEETFTTIAVYPGWQARIDDAGDCELARSESSRRG